MAARSPGAAQTWASKPMDVGDSFSSDDTTALRHLLSLDGDAGALWAPEEFAAIWQHQLDAPLQSELGTGDAATADRLGPLGSESPPLRSFGDLLHHPRPPVDLLALCKEFAKRCRNDSRGPLPDEVATVLYFSCIARALTLCGCRITRMDDHALGYGLEWALRQPWLDEPTRAILREGLSAIGAS